MPVLEMVSIEHHQLRGNSIDYQRSSLNNYDIDNLYPYGLTVNAIEIDFISFVPRPEWDISATGRLSCRLNLPEGRAPCALHILQ